MALYVTVTVTTLYNTRERSYCISYNKITLKYITHNTQNRLDVKYTQTIY